MISGKPPGPLGRLATRLERRGTALRLLGGLLWRLEHVARDPGELAIMARRLRVVWRLGGLSEVAKILGRRRFGERVDQRHYPLWVQRYDSMSPRGRRRVLRRVKAIRPVRIGVMLDARQATAEQLSQTIADLRAQLHGGWRALVRGDDVTLPSDEPRLALAKEGALPEGEWLCWLDARDRLPPWAFAAVALAASPELQLIYSDHDSLDLQGQRARPVFKPDWNATLLQAGDYFGPAVWLRWPVADGDPQESLTERHAFWQRLTARLAPEEIGHAPQVLLHLAHDAGARGGLLSEDPLWGGSGNTLGAHLRHTLPEAPPLVSVIVPTRDRLELLRPCLGTLLAVTTYPNFEVIVVDNGSVEPATLAFLQEMTTDPRVRVLRDERPFNFAALNNRAAQAARGDLLCLLNNDVEITQANWLGELAGWALRPEVGAVGARLLYPDGSLQHAGVVLGLGEAAGHLYRGQPSDPARAPRRSLLAQEVSAVTGACLVLRKADWDAVGGMNEQDFAVGYNDVDLCLKLAERGLKIIYTPHATLLHRESQSRGQPDTAEKIERQFSEIRALRRRWLARLRADPHYNPNLSIYDDQSSLAWPPRLSRPWL